MQGCMSSFGGMEPVELSKGLAQLKSEHPPLLDKLNDLYELTQLIEKENNPEDTFNQLTLNVREFISELDPHSNREEGVLFEMMGKYIGRTSGPIAVMEYEHDQAKTLIGTYLEKVNSDQPLSLESQVKYSSLIRNAYFILTEHFAKEENVLFPMAERMLTDDEKQELFDRIQEI
jgi:regulator of cell morphogenesis and NO signaling